MYRISKPIQSINPKKSIKLYQPNKTIKPIKPIDISNFTKEIYNVKIFEKNKEIFQEIKRRIKEKKDEIFSFYKKELKKFSFKHNMNKFLAQPVEISKITLKTTDLEEKKGIEEVIKQLPPIQLKDEFVSLPEEGYYLLYKYGNYDFNNLVSLVSEELKNIGVDEKGFKIAENFFNSFIKSKQMFINSNNEQIDLLDDIRNTAYNIAYNIAGKKGYFTVKNIANKIENVLKVIKLKQVMFAIKEMILNKKHPYYTNFYLPEGVNFLNSFAKFLTEEKVNRITDEFKDYTEKLLGLSNIDFEKLGKVVFDTSMKNLISGLTTTQIISNLTRMLGFISTGFLGALSSLVNFIISTNKRKEIKKALGSNLLLIQNGKYLSPEEASSEINKIKVLFDNDVEKAKSAYEIISTGHFLSELIGLLNSFKFLERILFLDSLEKAYDEKVNFLL